MPDEVPQRPQRRKRQRPSEVEDNAAFIKLWIKRFLIAFVVVLALNLLGVIELVRDGIESLAGWRPGG